jgi:protein-tyrosine-phosphatase
MENDNIKKKILFVCVENAGRSQMAEAFFNFYAKEKSLDWIAESSGTIPAKQVQPEVVEIMKEKNINLTDSKPKRFIPEKIGEYERVISFGCLVKAAFSPDVQNRIEEWQIDYPSDKPPEEIKRIRDEVENKVVNLINTL